MLLQCLYSLAGFITIRTFISSREPCGWLRRGLTLSLSPLDLEVFFIFIPGSSVPVKLAGALAGAVFFLSAATVFFRRLMFSLMELR